MIASSLTDIVLAVATRTLKHGLNDLDCVRDAITRAFQANVARLSGLSPTMVWKDAQAATLSVTVMMKPVTADLTITDQEVHLEGKVPFIFGHFEDKILSAVVEQLESSFAAARANQPSS